MEDGAIWQIKTTDLSAAESITAAFGLSPLTAQLMVNRGITTPEEADIFLNPSLDNLFDPFLLPDMEKAVARISKAIDTGEIIFLHGDYDADGVTSTALGLRALTAMGANVVPYVPKRSDGYDLQIVGVELARDKGATLIITADCGTRAIPAVNRANELGMEVIITDHHRPGDELPLAFAIINPYREGYDLPFQSLCGAGVLFKVMDALISVRRPSIRRAFQLKYLDLVALGTVADMTPLISENRILVTHGLQTLSQTTKKGLYTLLRSQNLNGKQLTAEHISFGIGPSLNAAGRMEDAEIAFRLLVTSDYDEAEQLTAQMAALKANSQAESARVTTEAMIDALSDEQAGRRVLVLAREKWGKGVVGLAAGRVVEACRRPVVLLALSAEGDMYVGSARSRGNFQLHTALAECHDLLLRYGGHSQSAGLSLLAENLPAFRDRINEVAMATVPEEPEPLILEADAEIPDARVLTLQLLEEFGRLEPFGEQNRPPVYITRGAEIQSVKRCGKDLATLQLQVLMPHMTRSIACVWFRNGEWGERLRIGDEIDLAYTPSINEFNGKLSVQLQLKDIKLMTTE